MALPISEPDDSTDLDVGPSFADMRLDEKSRRIIEWANEIDAANGVQPTVLPSSSQPSDGAPRADLLSLKDLR